MNKLARRLSLGGDVVVAVASRNRLAKWVEIPSRGHRVTKLEAYGTRPEGHPGGPRRETSMACRGDHSAAHRPSAPSARTV
jgi:hypothetical protein